MSISFLGLCGYSFCFFSLTKTTSGSRFFSSLFIFFLLDLSLDFFLSGCWGKPLFLLCVSIVSLCFSIISLTYHRCLFYVSNVLKMRIITFLFYLTCLIHVSHSFQKMLFMRVLSCFSSKNTLYYILNVD